MTTRTLALLTAITLCSLAAPASGEGPTTAPADKSANTPTTLPEQRRDKTGQIIVDRRAVEVAIKRGVAFLLSREEIVKPKDEPWFGIFSRQYSTTVTATCVMALRAAGHEVNDSSPEGEALRRSLDFLLRPGRIAQDGYLGEMDKSNMYGHGITTTVLVQLQGKGVNDTQNRLLAQRAHAALDFIELTQVHRGPWRGGWLYDPRGKWLPGGDSTQCAWLLTALVTAQQAGLKVTPATLRDAQGLLESLTSFPGAREDLNIPGFFYASTHTLGELSKHIRPSASVQQAYTLKLAGRADEDVKRVVRWLPDYPFDQAGCWERFFLARLMKADGGAELDPIRQRLRTDLIRGQKADGSWEDKKWSAGPEFSAALAIAALADLREPQEMAAK